MNPTTTQATVPNVGTEQYNVPNTQTLGTINNSGNLNLTPTPTTPNVAGTLTSLVNTQNTLAQNSQNSADTATNSFNSLLQQYLGQGADQAQLNQQYGTAENQKRIRDLMSLQSAQTARYIQGLNDIELAKNTRQEANAQSTMLNRQHGIDALLTSSQLQAEQGNLEFSQNLIKQAIDFKYEPIKAQLEYQKEIVSQLNTKAATEATRAFELKIKQIDSQMEVEKNIQNIAINASKNGATDSDIRAITSATNINDAIRLAAKFAVSPADKLDLAIKGMQLQKLQKENALIGQPTKEELKAQKEAMKTAKGSVPILEDKIALLDSILSGKASRAINSTVGTSLFSRTAGKFGGVLTRALIPGAQPTLVSGAVDTLSGARQDLIGSVNQMVSKEFLQAVLNLKSSGGTLGQLTEKEGAKLQQAATKIGSWEIRNNKDQVIGYNASEKDFRAEIQRIRDATQRILNEARGSTLSAEEQDLLDTIYNSGTDASAYFQ